jgi:hypothetical protein
MRSRLINSPLAAWLGVATLGLTTSLAGGSRSATAAEAAAQADELATEVVFGDDFAFSVEAPAGWSFAAPEAGRAGARCAPATAGSEAGAQITAEALAAAKDGKARTSRELTDAETTAARAVHPSVRVRYGDPIETAGQSVVVAKYTPAESDGAAAWVTTAFIATKTGGVRLALTAPTRAAHDASYQAFRNVVRSWRELPPAASH